MASASPRSRRGTLESGPDRTEVIDDSAEDVTRSDQNLRFEVDVDL